MLISPEIQNKLIGQLLPGIKIYLVGGAVRDSLLGTQVKDLDFVCSENTQEIARKFSDDVKGNFYALDKERNIFRVLLQNKDYGPYIFDFAQMRGSSIETDLMERDFTINAMAVDLRAPERIIDPCKGGRDLAEKHLRPVKKTCIQDDPVRMIRAARYGASLGLAIDQAFSAALRGSVSYLGQVPVERIRDEFFKLLDGENPGVGLFLLEHYGILEHMGLATRDKYCSGIRLVKSMELVFALFSQPEIIQKHQSFVFATLLSTLRNFRLRLKEYFNSYQATGRNQKSLLILAGLCSTDWSEKQGFSINNFGLSVNEKSSLLKILINRDRISEMTIEGSLPDNRAIYRFYKEMGHVGVDLVFLSLTTDMAKTSCENSQDRWLKLLKVCERLLGTWFEHPEIVNPKPLLSGNDLMFHFDLAPGPVIGELTEKMKEEQAAGMIADKKAALVWVDQQLIGLD